MFTWKEIKFWRFNVSAIISFSNSELPLSIIFFVISILLSMSNVSLLFDHFIKNNPKLILPQFLLSLLSLRGFCFFACLRGDFFLPEIWRKELAALIFLRWDFTTRVMLYSRMIISRGTYHIKASKVHFFQLKNQFSTSNAFTQTILHERWLKSI